MNTPPHRRVISYIGLTCLISWALIGGAYVLGVPWEGTNMMLLGCVLMWIPGAVALLMERTSSPGRVKRALRIGFRSNRWWVLAWLGAPTLTLLTIAVSMLLPEHTIGHDPSVLVDKLASFETEAQRAEAIESIESLPISLFWIQLLQGLTMGGLITALFATGEEIGWRGFLDREASHAGWGFWKSSLSIGALWGIWHWPIIVQGHNYPQHPELGVALMVLFCMGMAPLMTFVTRMGGSVLAAGLAHGTLNATAPLPMMVVLGGNDLTVGIASLNGLAVLLLANLALIPLVNRYADRLQTFWRDDD